MDQVNSRNLKAPGKEPLVRLAYPHITSTNMVFEPIASDYSIANQDTVYRIAIKKYLYLVI